MKANGIIQVAKKLRKELEHNPVPHALATHLKYGIQRR